MFNLDYLFLQFCHSRKHLQDKHSKQLLIEHSLTYLLNYHLDMSTKPNFGAPVAQQQQKGKENVQPLHHPGQHALVPKTNLLAQGHSEMGGKALLAKKMAASG